MREVTIGGESRPIGEFSGFKAAYALELIGESEVVVRKLLDQVTELQRHFEERNWTEVDRAEAKRMFAPEPLVRDVVMRGEDGEPLRDGDGVVVFGREPVLGEDGRPVLGPDPLGHLSEKDWETQGHKLRLTRSPRPELVWGAALPLAYREAKPTVLRLLALVLASNSDLDRWDRDSEVLARLDEEARELQRRASLRELMGLATTVARIVREDLRDPFEEMMSEVRETFGSPEEEQPAPTAGPMTVESEEGSDEISEPESTAGSPTSSTPSPGATEEPDSESLSTEPVSASSSSSESA